MSYNPHTNTKVLARMQTYEVTTILRGTEVVAGGIPLRISRTAGDRLEEGYSVKAAIQ